MRHAEITDLIEEAIKACYDEFVPPTRANVLERIGEYHDKAVTKRQLQTWTQNSEKQWTAPFRIVNDILVRVKADGSPIEEVQSNLDLQTSG